MFGFAPYQYLGATKGLFKAGGNLLRDPMGHGAINSSMAAQRRATKRANAALKSAYTQQRKDLQPWQQTGLRALSGLEDSDFQRDFTMGDFQQDPGYAFRMAEGQKALERSAAARGGLQSGGTLKALARYGQDFASNEYQNAYDRFNADRDRRFGRLSSLAGMGQHATDQLVGAAGNYGTMVSNNRMGLGNAYAAGGIAKANANQQTLSGLITLGGKAVAGA